jgi:predicted  nucleic acid-binding Zn-ribbon protein
VDARLGDDREVAQAGAQVEAALGKRKDLEKETHFLEGELENLRVKLSGVEAKLYGGRMTNFKELEDLQKEAEIFRQQRQRQEEEVLGLMEQLEEFRDQVAEGQRALAALQQRWQQEQEQLGTEQSELVQAISKLEGLREGAVSRIDPTSLRLYESIRQSRPQAAVRVEQGRCHGCRVALSMNEIQKARGGVIQCSSCGRILYSG